MNSLRLATGGRWQHIDVARGIGILFVVFGHNWIVLHEEGELFRTIFSFHMPLFFFLSGVFFSGERDLKSTILQKSDAILKPYFTTSLLVGIAVSLMQEQSLGKFLLRAVYGNGETIAWVPMWFLPHLWAVILVAYCLTKVFQLGQASMIRSCGVLVVALVTGIFTMNLFWYLAVRIASRTVVLPGLPFSADVVPVSVFYYLLGYIFKEKVFSFQINLKLLLLCLVTFATLHTLFDCTINLNLRRYDGPAISTAEALSGIYIVLSLSSLICKQKVFGTLAVALAYFGSGSLFILIFHAFIQDKLFFVLNSKLWERPYWTGAVAFVLASTFPLLLWELARRNRYLSVLWLPIKSAKKQCSLRAQVIEPQQSSVFR